VTNTTNASGPIVNGLGGNKNGPTQSHQSNQAKLHGSGRPTRADENHRTQSLSPPADFVLLRRETTTYRKEDGEGQPNGAGLNLQHIDDQDEELEYVQETPMEGG
jgi:hypothetical protein